MPFQFLEQFFKTLKMELTLENARKPFHVLTLTLISLLLPLSFLLIARLSYASFISILFPTTLKPNQTPFLLSLFFYPNNYPNPLHAAAAALTLAALLHSLTSKIIVSAEEPSPNHVDATHKPRLCVAWALICVLQVLVGLGIEGSISTQIAQPHFDTHRRTMLSQMVFFIGLHETTLYWCRAVVKPVVDDTVYGKPVAEMWAERAVIAAAYGGLWWLMMKDEVEALVIVAEVKKEMVIGVGMVDYFNWWLFYLIETIGMVRIVKGVVWMVMVLFCRIKENQNPKNPTNPKCGVFTASPKDLDMTMV